MALIKCGECGHMVSDRASACPACGHPVMESPSASSAPLGSPATRAASPSSPDQASRKAKGAGKTLKGILIAIGCIVVIGAIARSAKDGGTTYERAPAVTHGSAAPAAAPAGVVHHPQDSGDPLSFGTPTVKTTSGITRIMVEATNNTGNEISCMVTGTFMRGDTILGTANGAVNEIKPRGKRTAELISMDKVSGYDRVKLEASTCF